MSEKEEVLYKNWKGLKDKEDNESKAEKEFIEEELADEYFNKIKEVSQGVECAEGGNIEAEVWKLKKKLCPRSQDPPTAMMDEDGYLVTDAEAIKDMAVKAFKHRLRNCPMKVGLEDIKEAKKKLHRESWKLPRILRQIHGI